ncbi:hypothetical protein [Shewanella sp. 125m-1]
MFFNLRWPFSSLQKVFMGDAGSMLIGLTVVWSSVQSQQIQHFLLLQLFT